MIASSLLAIVGYQLVFLGLAGKVYRAKMDMPNDKIVEFLTKRLSLEKGAMVGFSRIPRWVCIYRLFGVELD